MTEWKKNKQTSERKKEIYKCRRNNPSSYRSKQRFMEILLKIFTFSALTLFPPPNTLPPPFFLNMLFTVSTKHTSE